MGDLDSYTGVSVGFCTDDDDDLLYLYVLYGVLKTAVLPVAG